MGTGGPGVTGTFLCVMKVLSCVIGVAETRTFLNLLKFLGT